MRVMAETTLDAMLSLLLAIDGSIPSFAIMWSDTLSCSNVAQRFCILGAESPGTVIQATTAIKSSVMALSQKRTR